MYGNQNIQKTTYAKKWHFSVKYLIDLFWQFSYAPLYWIYHQLKVHKIFKNQCTWKHNIFMLTIFIDLFGYCHIYMQLVIEQTTNFWSTR